MTEGEKFYVSLGFDSLPQIVTTKNRACTPPPPNADYKKEQPRLRLAAWTHDKVRTFAR